MSFEEQIVYSRKIEDLKTAINLTYETLLDYLSLVENTGYDELTIKCHSEFLRLSCDYVNQIEQLTSLFTVSVDWIPSSFLLSSSIDNGQFQEVELTYSDGNSPWSFWLKFKPSSEYDSIVKMLQGDRIKGKLKNLTSLPEPGTYVVCTDRNYIFRALVLSTTGDKIRVRNIDCTSVKVVKLDSLFYLLRKYCSLHAQTVHCSLIRDESLKNLWNSDLSDLFKDILKECNLKIKFINMIDNNTGIAKYYINMETTGDNCVNFNEWINDKMLPELIKFQGDFQNLILEDLPQQVLDPFYIEDDKGKYNNGDEKEDYFNDESLVTPSNLQSEPWSPHLFLTTNSLISSLGEIPQYEFQTGSGSIAAQYTTTTVFTNQCLGANVKFPQQLTTTSSFIVNANNLPKSTLNINTPVFEPRNAANLPKNLSIIQNEKKTSLTGESSDDGFCLTFMEKGYCLKPGCTRQHISKNQSSAQSTDEDDINNQPQDLKSVPEIAIQPIKPLNKNVDATTSQFNEILSTSANQTNTGENNCMSDDDLEEPCINGGYIPTDESRLCKFPATNGSKCWKKFCTKEHREKDAIDKWTTDQIEVINDLYNWLDLPKEGETVQLVVTCVVSPILFYARLPNECSDIGESSVEDIETFGTLHEHINHSKNISNYKHFCNLNSCESELCLAQSSIDHTWRRARIIDDFDKKVKVFYLDYGTEEIVSTNSLRVIESRFCHLPAQAVLCSLSNLYCNSDDFELKMRACKFLESKIKEKVIEGKVVSSINEELSLIVSLKGVNINSLMVSRGLCEDIGSTK